MRWNTHFITMLAVVLVLTATSIAPAPVRAQEQQTFLPIILLEEYTSGETISVSKMEETVMTVQAYLPIVTWRTPPNDRGDSRSWAGIEFLSDLIIHFEGITAETSPCETIFVHLFDTENLEWIQLADRDYSVIRHLDHSEARISYIFWVWWALNGSLQPENYIMVCY